MAKLSDLRLSYRIFLRNYPYRRVDWRPGARLTKPLAESRIALITTAGLYLPDQPPFSQSIRHDDCSFREIPFGTPVQSLLIGQSSGAFDPAGIEADRNLAFPLDHLAEIAIPAPRHFSFNGSILAPARLISESAPEVAHRLHEDAVDGVLLTPV